MKQVWNKVRAMTTGVCVCVGGVVTPQRKVKEGCPNFPRGGPKILRNVVKNCSRKSSEKRIFNPPLSKNVLE